MRHTITFRIYYEDTDSGGVVYYANYLKFAERARTEWLRELGFDQSRLFTQENILIVVRRCEVDYLASARLDDEITVQTHLHEVGKVRMTMQQEIRRAGAEIAKLTVVLACINTQGKPTGWPQALLDALEKQ